MKETKNVILSPLDHNLPNRNRNWEVVATRNFGWQRISPAQLFVSSFLLLIFTGTILFMIVPVFYVGSSLSFVDALFTATSAVCVTGLIVVDTASYFSTYGQIFLLFLIQLGGLGMLTFTSIIIVTLGKRLSVRQETLYFPSSGLVSSGVDSNRLVRHIVTFALGIEFIGALLLWISFGQLYGFKNGFWPAIFHSVSAFCNAGFSLFSDSLMHLNTSPGVLLTVSFLITTGGIGFLTLEDFALYFSSGKKKRHRLSLQSKIILLTSFSLLLIGTLMFVLLEWNSGLSGLSPEFRFVNAFFLSVTSRTAGFNSIDHSLMTDAGNFFTIILMMIGGSPGSTAGGLKTTTFFLIGLLAWSRIRGDMDATFLSRSVRQETLSRAVGLFVIGFGVITVSVLMLSVFETSYGIPGRFLELLFEVVSAFNTVGLSIGNTASLSDSAKFLLVILMFIGRVGPLAFAAAIFTVSSRKKNFRYSYEDVIVG
ncbi:MAG TPA: potassium transporter TrkG [Oligoflexia bacterium]|nr:potassium transporter TrkG [Oligoflexia bacterium]HMP47183.1 potassium transporter TrkG [Oligoflexia bacterium]